jgi:hypothetical protein
MTVFEIPPLGSFPLFSLIDALSMGQRIIEDGGRFQPFDYAEIPFPDGSLLVRLARG